MSVYIRGGSCTVDGHLADDCDRTEFSCRDDNGYPEAADDFRNVQQPDEPGSGGCACACTMYSVMSSPMGAGVTHRHCRRKTGTQRQLQMRLCLWRYDIDKYDPGDDGTDSVEGGVSV